MELLGPSLLWRGVFDVALFAQKLDKSYPGDGADIVDAFALRVLRRSGLFILIEAEGNTRIHRLSLGGYTDGWGALVEGE